MSAPISACVVTAAMLVHAGATPAIIQRGSGTTTAPTTPGRTACSVITSQEISGILGTRVREGEPQDAQSGTACQFRSSDVDWVNIAVGPMDAKLFASTRQLMGKQAEIQAGVGDEAFFWGNVRIYVRVGTQGLIITFARNDQGNATTKAQVLALAKLAAPRLR